MSFRISTVVCTLDRADYLGKALASLADQSLPDDRYEVIVVDNGSRDHTREVVALATGSVPNLRLVEEPRPGLSHARNTGWSAALGAYVAFLDDDAVASRGWLETIVATFETIRPTPASVGGRIDPIWEAPRPPWLGDSLLPALAILDHSPIPRELESGEVLFGANMAFDKSALEAVGGFTPLLGRKGSSLLSMEEIQLQRRLRDQGFTSYYHPEILVSHHVSAERLTKRWFLRRWYWQGVSRAIVDREASRTSGLERLARAGATVVEILRELGRRAFRWRAPDALLSNCRVLSKVGYLLATLRA